MESALELHEEVSATLGHDGFNGVVLWPSGEFWVSGVSDEDLEKIDADLDNLTLRKPKDTIKE